MLMENSAIIKDKQTGIEAVPRVPEIAPSTGKDCNPGSARYNCLGKIGNVFTPLLRIGRGKWVVSCVQRNFGAVTMITKDAAKRPLTTVTTASASLVNRPETYGQDDPWRLYHPACSQFFTSARIGDWFNGKMPSAK